MLRRGWNLLNQEGRGYRSIYQVVMSQIALLRQTITELDEAIKKMELH
jgi:hypothetical protein